MGPDLPKEVVEVLLERGRGGSVDGDAEDLALLEGLAGVDVAGVEDAMYPCLE
jgi:hypothetical protein